MKLTFAKGASVDDPAGLFNSSLEGKVRRAIDFHEGDQVDEEALKALFQAAVDVNEASCSPLSLIHNSLRAAEPQAAAGAHLRDDDHPAVVAGLSRTSLWSM